MKVLRSWTNNKLGIFLQPSRSKERSPGPVLSPSCAFWYEVEPDCEFGRKLAVRFEQCLVCERTKISQEIKLGRGITRTGHRATNLVKVTKIQLFFFFSILFCVGV